MQRVPPTQIAPTYSGTFVGRDEQTVLGSYQEFDFRGLGLNASLSGSNLYAEGNWLADRYPTNPHPLNEEFDGPTVGPAWGMTTGGYGSVDFNDYWPGWAHVYFAGNQSWTLTAPSGMPTGTAFSLACKFAYHVHDNYQSVYLYALNTAQTEGIRVAYLYNSAIGGAGVSVSRLNAGTWAYEITSVIVGHGARQYLMMERDSSNNWYGRYSDNGLSWVRTAAVAKTFTFTRLYVQANQVGRTEPMHVGIDWIRCNWLQFEV